MFQVIRKPAGLGGFQYRLVLTISSAHALLWGFYMAKIRLRVLGQLAQQQGVAAPLPDDQLGLYGTTLTGTGTASITGLATGAYMEIFCTGTNVLYKHGTGITALANADGFIPSGGTQVSGTYTGQTSISFKLD